MRGRQSIPHIMRRSVAIVLSLGLSGFFAFVGFMKATAPVSDLSRYHAWTVHLPEWLGRAVGWSEIGCALLLIAGTVWPRWGRIGAITLLINQLFASAVHSSHQEMGSLSQNGVIVAMCLMIFVLLMPGPIAASSHRRAS